MGNAKGTREERRAAAIARIGYDRKRLNEIERGLHPIDRLVVVAAGSTVAEYVTWKAKKEMEARK